MKIFNEYKQAVETSRKRRNAGKIECKFRPTNEHGETIFSKHIAFNSKEESAGIFYRLFTSAERKAAKSKLTEKNYEDSCFNQWIEISENEFLEDGYQTFQERVISNFSQNYNLHRTCFRLELGEFVPYPEVKELDFEDIPDLRNIKNGK